MKGGSEKFNQDCRGTRNRVLRCWPDL